MFAKRKLMTPSHFLRTELLAKLKGNSSYSLRAFARSLKLSPGYLSQVLNDKRSLSEEKALAISQQLKWAPDKRELFVNLVRVQSSKDPRFKQYVLDQIHGNRPEAAEFKDLQLDQFALIADWYHFAILELSRIYSSRLDEKLIAAKLGISPFVAREALERLVRLDCLKRTPSGYFTPLKNYQIKDIPSDAIRSFHHQQLDLAKEALENQPLDAREFQGVTMAINPKKIKRAKELILRFSKEIMECLEEGTPSAIYHFSTQLYRLDQSDPKGTRS